MIKVIKFKKLKSGNKKYEITFNKNGKTYTRKFGASGMSDYTKHKDKERRERYIARHKKDLKTNDPMRAGYLSMYILWNKQTVPASLADYKRRLGVYNRTGKFPRAITGSKKLSKFGAMVDFNTPDSYINNLPRDLQELIQKEVSASEIQQAVRTREWPSKLLKDLLQSARLNITKIAPNEERRVELNQLITASPYVASEYTDGGVMGRWFKRLSILPYASFIKKNRSSVDISSIVQDFLLKFSAAGDHDGEIDMHQYDIDDVANSLILILIKCGYPIKNIPPTILEDTSNSYPRVAGFSFWVTAHYWWTNNIVATTNSFGTKSSAPTNVINKKLYLSIKAKINRSIKGRRWGAYDSGRLVREYVARGGKYSGVKGKTKLGRWYKENWVDACAWPKRKPCGRKTSDKVAYCRPSKRVDAKTPKLVQKLSKTQIKSRCSAKKRSPMKRVTKFGGMRDLGSIRNHMLANILGPGDVSDNIVKTINLRCKSDFNSNRCQRIFTELILSIYFTLVKRGVGSGNMNELTKFIPKDFSPSMIFIHKNSFDKLKEFLYLIQDHSYGTFKNARLASLTYETLI